MTKEEMIEVIYENIADGIYNSYSEDETIFPVMIGDVLDFFEIKRIEIMQSENYDESVEGPEYGYGPVIHRWKEKRKPIEEQSEETIKYIYNLIK